MELRCRECGNTEAFDVNYDAYTTVNGDGGIRGHYYVLHEDRPMICYDCGSTDIHIEGGDMETFLLECKERFINDL